MEKDKWIQKKYRDSKTNSNSYPGNQYNIFKNYWLVGFQVYGYLELTVYSTAETEGV